MASTIDFRRKSWPNCRLWFQKLTDFDSCIIFQKIATFATSWLSTFRGFCCGFFIGFQWENGRIRTKWPQNLQKFPSKVNSQQRGRSEILQQLTFLEKVDHTVDYGFKSWPYCRLWFQKLTILSTMVSKGDHRTVDFFKKNPATVDFSKRNHAIFDLFFYRDRLEALPGLIRPSRRKPKCDRTSTGHLNRDWMPLDIWMPPGHDWMPLDNDKS